MISSETMPNDTWTLHQTTGLTDLVEALSRAADKGYLPDAVAEEWRAFDYRPVASPERPDGAGAASGVRVKPLEWEDKPGVRFADTRIGTYWAYADGTLKLDGVQLSFDRNRLWSETQAAAQADYAARIRAALAPSPSAGEPT